MHPDGLAARAAAGNEAAAKEPQTILHHPTCLCPLLERFEFLEKDNLILNRHFTLKAIVRFVSGK
jgi:hypothetical protein